MENEIIQRVRVGFGSLNIDEAKKEAALLNLERWYTQPPFAEYRNSIDHLVNNEAWDLLLFNFFQTLPFGTGGRRGAVGVGPNCFNPYTLATSVQGHVDYMRSKFDHADLEVIIAYDVRHFLDVKQRYSSIPDNPLQGKRSRDFAKIAAEVYAANGVRVHMPDPTDDWIVSTPELSYMIRAVGAHGGLNVSASHNHPDDNGGKFYDQDGGQEVPPNDEKFSTFVAAIDDALHMPFDSAQAEGLVQYLDRQTMHDGYINLIVGLSLRPQERNAVFTMSNLHGAGDTNVGDTLERAGFPLHYVASQRAHDGQFPNVPFRIANPEVQETMEAATNLARELKADAVFATDPDADRIGLVAPKGDGSFHFFNGNEIGALVTDQMFSRMQEDGRLPERPLFVTTEVTSRLPGALAKYHGATVVDDLLVGCKYIANVIACMDKDGHFRGLQGHPDDYVLGLEESHGVMVTSQIRDKDAAGAALMLAERASEEKSRGKTLYDALLDTWRKVGIHATRQVSIVIEGAIGMEQIASIQNNLLQLEEGDLLGGRAITRKDNFLSEEGHGPYVSDTDRKARNFVSFEVEGGFRVLARPSGTEPKIKLYTEGITSAPGMDTTRADLETRRDELNAELTTLTDEVAQQAYSILGIDMPIWGLRVSSLLGLSARQDFVTSFLPEFQKEAATLDEEQLTAWTIQRVQSYGKDPRALVRNGVECWLQSQSLDQAINEKAQKVFFL
jgi:phosphoglucomutase